MCGFGVWHFIVFVVITLIYKYSAYNLVFIKYGKCVYVLCKTIYGEIVKDRNIHELLFNMFTFGTFFLLHRLLECVHKALISTLVMSENYVVIFAQISLVI